MSLELLVSNTDLTPYVARWDVSKAGTVEVLNVTLHDRWTPGANSAVRLPLGAVYRLEHDGALIAGGTLDASTETHVVKGEGAVSRTTLACIGRGHEALASTIHVEHYVLPAQTVLKSYADLCTEFLAPRGVTNIGSTSGGEEHGELTFDHVSLQTVLDTLVTLTGCVWRINGALQFAAAAPGSWVGPTLDQNNASIHEFRVEHSRLTQITRAYGSMALDEPVTHSETKIGDGVRFVWPSNVLVPRDTNTAPVITVTEGANVHTIGTSNVWSFHANSSTFTRSSALANSANAVIAFAVGPSVTIRQWDPSAIHANGAFDPSQCVDGQIDISTQTNIGTASELMRTTLVRRGVAPRTVTVLTRESDIWPLQKVAMSFPAANVSGDWLVSTVDIEGDDKTVWYRVSATEGGTHIATTWADQFKGRGSTGISGAVVAVGGGTSGGGSTSLQRIPVGGTAYRRMAAQDWTDAPGAVPIRAGGPAWTGTWTLRVPAYVTASNTSIEARLWSATNGVAGTTGATNTTSWTALTATCTFPLTEGTYLLQTRIVGGGNATCGDSVLEH